MDCATPHKRTAFTLIELLVVISIIALLIGILLPSLGAARESAQSVQCLSQQRQTGLAITMYANDFKDWTPINYQGAPPSGSFPIADGDTPRSSHGVDWWHRFGGKLVDWGDDQHPTASWEDRASYLSTTKGFYCPSVEYVRPDDWWGSTGIDNLSNPSAGGVFTSYMWEFWNPQQYSGDPTHMVNTEKLGTAKITENSQNVILTDIGWEPYAATGNPIYGPAPHQDSINAMHLDGHASSASLSGLNAAAPVSADAFDRLVYLRDN